MTVWRELRWHHTPGEPRFRNIPINMHEREEILASRPLSEADRKHLEWLEAEFEILWRFGIIYHRGDVRALINDRQGVTA